MSERGGGPPPLKGRAVRSVVIALVLMTAFAFFFVYPGHDPEPNGLPVAATAGTESLPGIEIVPAADAAEIRRMIRDREVYGGATGSETFVASAASFTVAQLLRELSGSGKVTDVVPLDPQDPRGQSLNLLVIPVVVTAILAALVASGLLFGAPLGLRLGLSVLVAVAGALLIVLVVHTGIGALPGSFLGLWSLTALGILALNLPSGAILRLLGPPGTGVPFLLFLMVGSPASGAATAPELLPTPWAEGGQLMPPGAIATALRNIAYFDAAQIVKPLLVLLAWAAAGLALHLVAERKEARA